MSDESTAPAPTDRTVIDTASDAAEGVVLSEYRQSEIRDMDVTVRFSDGELEVDVYLNAPESASDGQAVVEAALEAAEAAVDELFAESA